MLIIDINDNNQRPNTKGSTYSPFGIDVNTNFHLYIHVYLYILYLYLYILVIIPVYPSVPVPIYPSCRHLHLHFFPHLTSMTKEIYQGFIETKKIRKICSPWNPSLIYELMQEKRGIKHKIFFLTLQILLLREVL